MKEINKLMSFLDSSYTSFHAVKNIKEKLEANGFTDMTGQKIQKGGSYYKLRNDSSIIAVKIPKNTSSFKLISAHNDSPCYRLKNSLFTHKNGYTLLNLAGYGGMIHSSFMDRPLRIAGRVIYQKNNELLSDIIELEDRAIIANLAIHMNRNVNNGYEYKVSRDMKAIISDKEIDLRENISSKLDGELIDFDLYLCSDTKSYLWAENSLISSPRLDDLSSVYAGLRALVSSNSNDSINILAAFDNEEVGSSSYMGADSDLLYSVIIKIREDLNISESKLYEMLENSICISSDNAHALHPNYTDYYDVDNSSHINNGLVIKYSSNQKYTTNAKTAAYIKLLCKKTNKNYQIFENHSDVQGGSTLGNISNSQISIPSVDVGLPQLAMHSALETAGVNDYEDMVEIFKEHYR